MSKAASGRPTNPAQGRTRSRTLAAERALEVGNRMLAALTEAQQEFIQGSAAHPSSRSCSPRCSR